MQKKQRIAWLDMAKGYGMLLVIFAHVCVKLSDGGMDALLPLCQWIYSFHMPLFFLLSGYVFSAREPLGQFVLKKAKAILLPYLCLGLPMPFLLIYHHYQAGTLTLHSFIGAFVHLFLQDKMWTIWFLTCLFCLNILFYICLKLLKTNFRLLLSAVFFPCAGLFLYNILHVQAVPWNIDICFMAYPFFFAGYWCKTNRERIEEILGGNRRIATVIAAVCINLVFHSISVRLSGQRLDMYMNQYGIPLLAYPAAFSGIYFAIVLSKLYTAKPILYIGQNSLLYIAWHQEIAMPVFRKLIPESIFLSRIPSEFWASFLWVSLQTILITVFLTLINQLILSSKLKFILGK